LEKVGSYGKNLDTIKNEMGMMQESFEKMIPSMHERSYAKNNNKNGNNNNRKEDYEENAEETSEEPQEETTTTSVIRKKTSKTKK